MLIADTCYTSALTFAEARRAIRRARATGRLDAAGAQTARRRVAEFEGWADILPVNDEVLADLAMASSDERVRENATALELEVVPAAR